MKNKVNLFFQIIIAFLFQINCYSQDVGNPYLNSSPLLNTALDFPVNNSPLPVSFYNTSNYTGYDGEYEIILPANDFFWGNFFLGIGTNTYTISYSMEVVSFPFLPDCYLNTSGCSGVANRNLIMPAQSQARGQTYIKRGVGK